MEKLCSTAAIGAAFGLVRVTGQVAASRSITPAFRKNAAHGTSPP